MVTSDPRVIAFTCLFLAVLGLCCCTDLFSSCSEWGLLTSCSVHGVFIDVASFVVELRL